MKILCYLWTIIFVFCIQINNICATHIMGLDLTYQCIGNNQYEVYLSFYRDCNGSNAPLTPLVDWDASCGAGAVQLQLVSQTDITPSCMGINSSICNGGSGQYGIEEYVYKGTLQLPPSCNNIMLSYRNCCRNHSITTISNNNSKIYVEAWIGSSNNCNNSPVFTNQPVPFVCVNQPVLYNHGASDSDGDQLLYSLTDCYAKSGETVQYMSGFSGNNPLNSTNGLSIDTNTGAISFTPQNVQVGVICVLVEEFRNGQKIGSVVRDIQFNVIACNNQVPTLSGVNGTNQYHISVQANDSLCFNVFSNDADSNQTTQIQWNAAIGQAVLSVSGSPFEQGQICWTPTDNDVGLHSFTMTVSDNYCPIMGQNTYTYSIEVLPDSAACDSIDLQIIAVQNIQCAQNDGVAVVQANNGSAPYLYQLVNWTTGDFYSNNHGTFANLTAGHYMVWVEDSQGCTPACSGQNFQIGGHIQPLQVNVQLQQQSCPTINPADSNNHQGGNIQVFALSGTAPYLYSIDGIHFQPNGTFNNLQTGHYQIVVVDSNGCHANIDTNLTAPPPIQIHITQLTGSSCGAQNGQLQLSATGGNGGFNFILNNHINSINGQFNNLAAGQYQLSVIDQQQCRKDTIIVIPQQSAGFTLHPHVKQPSCFGNCDASIMVQSSDSTASMQYLWNNNTTQADLYNLCAGHYSLTATNAQGCTQTLNIHLTDPNPLQVSVGNLVDESCAGNDGAAQVQIQGGVLPYQITLANFHANQTYNSSNGFFNNLQQGHYLVQVIDSNGCAVDCPEKFDLGGCIQASKGPIAMLSNLPALLEVNPNPAESLVQIRYHSAGNSAAMLLVDANGKQVLYNKQLPARGSVEWSIEDLNNGLYYVLLYNQQNKLIKSTRLVIGH